MIPFNKPFLTGKETDYIKQAVASGKISGNGIFTNKCQAFFQDKYNIKKAFLTTSCTDALEMCSILLNIKEGDEVIMPSYTFVSTANAFVMRGAKIVFADSSNKNPNIDVHTIENLITKKTKAIVVVHYAGIACNMDVVMTLAKKYNLFVVEDAAQAIDSYYKDRPLGSIGHLGTFSFHETKNYTSAGEGGLLIINDEKFIQKAEIIREKGTNRSQFFRGMVDKYSWVDIGSSYLMSELNAAYLYGQLFDLELITKNRLNIWQLYYDLLRIDGVELPTVLSQTQHNAHVFYIKLVDSSVRARLIKYLMQSGIKSVFHYIPLHSSKAGKELGVFVGSDDYTTKDSERLLRLPLYFGLDEVERVCTKIESFFSA